MADVGHELAAIRFVVVSKADRLGCLVLSKRFSPDSCPPLYEIFSKYENVEKKKKFADCREVDGVAFWTPSSIFGIKIKLRGAEMLEIG